MKLYINEEKLKEFPKEQFYVVTDFDHTLTSAQSASCFGVLERGNFLPECYKKESKALYDKYHPIEFDFSISEQKKMPMMISWWKQALELLATYQLKKEVIEHVDTIFLLKFRKGAELFLKEMYERSIPVIIISAGIGDVIKAFLRYHNLDYPNIHIVSNFFCFEDGIATGFQGNLIHTLNKNIVLLPDNLKEKLNAYPSCVLMGDHLADSKMVNDCKKEILKIGFLNDDKKDTFKKFQEVYDIVGNQDTTLNEIQKLLRR